MRRRWIVYLNIFLSLLVAALGVNFFFSLKSYEEENIEVSDLSTAPQSQSLKGYQRALADYSIIYERDLFHLKRAPESVKSVSEAPTPLKLKGTVVGGEKFTFCIIEDKSKRKEELYQIGDTVENMKITAINEDNVILEDGEEKIVLYIEGAKEEGLKTPSPVKEKPLDLSRIEHPSPRKWVVRKEDVQQAVKNASQILSEIKIRPYFSSGRMEGFKVSSMEEKSIASAMGIQKGDIIKKINGKVIDSPKKIFEFYRNLEKSPIVELEIERSGKTQVLTYEIKP
ncbi:MAG TPA: hypothetical protein EYP78_06190 [Candidatus Omnitrophica bacterium]|nr:hypothetical protein [Candidatus Omnitrophota bacterium]